MHVVPAYQCVVPTTHNMVGYTTEYRVFAEKCNEAVQTLYYYYYV